MIKPMITIYSMHHFQRKHISMLLCSFHQELSVNLSQTLSFLIHAVPRLACKNNICNKQINTHTYFFRET